MHHGMTSAACLALQVAVGAAAVVPLHAETAPAIAATPTPEEPRSLGDKLGDIIDPVRIDNATAKEAFSWWSQTTGIPLVIDWSSLERAGVMADTPIHLSLNSVPAGQVLSLIMQQASLDHSLIFEKTPWCIRILTKDQANKELILRMYDVGDMVHESRLSSRPPEFNLNSVLNSSNVGRNANSTRSIFERADTVEGPALSNDARGEEIAQLIRDTIEPLIWRENGGEAASCRYFKGRLIVNAPLYVHSQIGWQESTATGAVNATPPTALRRSTVPSVATWQQRLAAPSSQGRVSGIDSASATRVSTTK